MTKMKVQCVDVLGSDMSVVNAARVSFAKFCDDGNLTDRDKKLITYLADHSHWSPFAHCFMTFRIKAPIFVARQLVKHQIGLAWNEVSRRYVSDDPEFYVPDQWRAAPTDGAKQGSSPGTDLDHRDLADMLENNNAHALEMYQYFLDAGVAPEMARMVLPQNMMTEWIWSGSLYAFARVCNLRLDPHAQAETGEIAKRISFSAKKYFPVSWAALVKQHAMCHIDQGLSVSEER